MVDQTEKAGPGPVDADCEPTLSEIVKDPRETTEIKELRAKRIFDYAMDVLRGTVSKEHRGIKTEEAASRVWEAVDDARRDGRIRGDRTGSTRKYIRKSAKNKRLDMLKVETRAGKGVEHGRDADQLQAGGVDAELSLIQAEVAAILRAAIDSLPPPNREVVVLKHFQEETEGTFETIAAYLGVPISTAKSRYQRGMKLLRAKLAQAYLEQREASEEMDSGQK